MSDNIQGHCIGESIVQRKVENGLSYSHHLSGIKEIRKEETIIFPFTQK
jgi:hypothetical protein